MRIWFKFMRDHYSRNVQNYCISCASKSSHIYLNCDQTYLGFFSRYFVIGQMIISFLPLSNLLSSDPQYIFPMEMNFFERPNSSLNFFANFSLQTVEMVHYSLVFYIICLIFFVMVINVMCELKVIVSLCRMIGDAKGRLTTENEGTLFKKVPSITLDEIDGEITDKLVKRSETTSKLLKMILKCHSNIIS